MQTQAEHSYHVGTHWQHQSSRAVYEITGHSIDEALGVPRLHYRPVICDGRQQIIRFGEAAITSLNFSRPASEFDEIVEWHDGEMSRKGRRFVKVIRSEEWIRV